MKQLIRRFALVSGACFLLVAMFVIASLQSPLIMGEDPYSLMRYVIIRITAATLAAPFLGGLMILTDYLTPGDWMETIGHDPKACSYLMSAVIVVIGAILCWA